MFCSYKRITMSEVVKVTKSGQRMSCSICHRTSSPIHLSSCFHSYCNDCLNVQVTSAAGQYQCPICRTAVNVSEMANRDYGNVRDNISPSGNIHTIRLGDGNSPNRNLQNVRFLDSTSPTPNVQTIRLGGENPRITSRSYATDQAGNLLPTSTSSDNLINVIQTSPNTRSYVMTSNGLAPRNGDSSRTYVAEENQPSPTYRSSPTNQGLPMTRTWTSSTSTDGKACDICQDGRKASSFCPECDQYFCETCSKAHIRMKASRYHELKRVSQSGKNLSHQASILSKEPSVKEFCARHGNEVSILCKRCETMICGMCQSQEHYGHATRPIAEEATEVRKNLTVMLQRQITLSERMKTQLAEADRRKDVYPRDLDQELGKLNLQIEEMQIELEREKHKAADELTNHYRSHADQNAELLENSQRNYSALMEVKAEVLEVLNSNDDVYVATRGNKLQKKLDNIERECRRKDIPLSSGPTLQFYQGEIDPGKIRNMIGGVTTSNERYETFPALSNHSNRSPSLHSIHSTQSIHTIMSTPRSENAVLPISATTMALTSKFSIPFTDGVGYVYGIAPVDPNKAWITLLGHTSVSLVSRTGSVLQTVRLADITEDVAHDGVGGCYVTCPSSKCIKHVTSEGIFTTIVDELLQDPHGIAFHQYKEGETLKQELYVCFTESMGTRTSLFEKPKGSVHVLDNNGEDLGRGFHMQSPTRIDVQRDMMCISDHSKGCVTVSDKTGQNIQALYTGVDIDGLKPLGVCFDDNGLVIIADWKGEQVIRIDRDGAHSEILVRDVKGPQSVAFKNWYLWVGGKHGSVHVYQMANE